MALGKLKQNKRLRSDGTGEGELGLKYGSRWGGPWWQSGPSEVLKETREQTIHMYVHTHTHMYIGPHICVNTYREACSGKSLVFEGSEGGASLARSRGSEEACGWSSEQAEKEEMWELMTGMPRSGAPEPSQLGSLGTGGQPEWTSIWPGPPWPLCGKQTLEEQGWK